MQNKKARVRKEMQNLFSDPRFARKAWQAVGQASGYSATAVLRQGRQRDTGQPCRTLHIPATCS